MTAIAHEISDTEFASLLDSHQTNVIRVHVFATSNSFAFVYFVVLLIGSDMVESSARFTLFWRGRIIGQADAGESKKTFARTSGKGMAAVQAWGPLVLSSLMGRTKNTMGRTVKPEGDPENSRREQEEALLKKLIVDEVGLVRITIQYCKTKKTEVFATVVERGPPRFAPLGVSLAPSPRQDRHP